MTTLSTIAIELAEFLKNEILTPVGILSDDRQLALDILDKWETNDLKTPFAVNPTRLKFRLKKLVENPVLLNQGPFGICVTQSFLYVIAKDYPYKFVNFAINLIESGNAHIGNLYIKTSKDFKKANFEGAIPAELIAEGMHECDILLIGAVRDSRNRIYDFDLTEDNMVMDFFNSHSYTESDDDFTFWFKETGLYKPVVFIENKNINIVDAINKSGKKNETIVLRIYTTGDESKPLQLDENKKAHRCALYINSIMAMPPDKYAISLATWGITTTQILSEQELKDCIFGFFELNRKS